MANKKVIFIHSAVGNIKHPTTGDFLPLTKAVASYVVEYEDVLADAIVAAGWAIPFEGWDTNPKRPTVIRYPK